MNNINPYNPAYPAESNMEELFPSLKLPLNPPLVTDSAPHAPDRLFSKIWFKIAAEKSATALERKVEAIHSAPKTRIETAPEKGESKKRPRKELIPSDEELERRYKIVIKKAASDPGDRSLEIEKTRLKNRLGSRRFRMRKKEKSAQQKDKIVELEGKIKEQQSINASLEEKNKMLKQRITELAKFARFASKNIFTRSTASGSSYKLPASEGRLAE